MRIRYEYYNEIPFSPQRRGGRRDNKYRMN
jgi:hypothetical protein